MKRLKGADTALANFLASGILRLREKLGPILWQLPPNFAYDRGRLESFFRSLPRTTTAAAALARHHDSKVAGRAWTKSRFRSAHCVTPWKFVIPLSRVAISLALLREQDIALVVADTAGKWPFLEDATSDFVYVRLHGDTELYVSGYTPSALQSWAGITRTWAGGRTPAGATGSLHHNEPSITRARCVCLLRQRCQSSRSFRRDVAGAACWRCLGDC